MRALPFGLLGPSETKPQAHGETYASRKDASGSGGASMNSKGDTDLHDFGAGFCVGMLCLIVVFWILWSALK